jgi:DNA-binding CsgD family transcriptional regulator
MRLTHERLSRTLINQISKLYKEGVAPIAIAERLSEKRNRIYYALRREGVVLQGRRRVRPRRRPRPHPASKRIIQKYRTGHSCRAIAQMHGLSGQAVLNILRRFEVKIRPVGQPKKASRCGADFEMRRTGQSNSIQSDPLLLSQIRTTATALRNEQSQSS